MKNWFTVEPLAEDTFAISEYGHWEETHCYLLCGTKRSLLIDAGLGVADLRPVVRGLTAKPVTAIATHIHFDHIGALGDFEEFYVHPEEEMWVRGAFPLPLAVVKQNLLRGDCTFPDTFTPEVYTLFKGTPDGLVQEGDVIDLGSRHVLVLHTPGHSPGHLCFFEQERGDLYTGDLVYQGTLYANYESTNPAAYLKSLEKLCRLPVRRLLPGHHTLTVPAGLLPRTRDAFFALQEDGLLHHGAGHFDYQEFSIEL